MRGSGSRTAGLVTFPAKDRTADLWLEWYSIVFSAVIADDLIPRWGVFAKQSLFRSAFRTPLRRHHISLVKYLLVLFGKKKYLLALDTRDLDVRHSVYSFVAVYGLPKFSTHIAQRLNAITWFLTVPPNVSRL